MIYRHERVIAYYANHDSTACVGRTRPFPFPQPFQQFWGVDGFTFCRMPDCNHCARSPEFAPMHYDCHEIFMQAVASGSNSNGNSSNSSNSSDADELHVRQRLWMAAAWRKPWRHAQPLYFVSYDFGEHFRRAASLCGLSFLVHLPPELLVMVRKYSDQSLFWRCISVFRLASSIATVSPQPLQSVGLGDILSWKRHGTLVRTTSSDSPLPVLRIVIDSEGILEVERLATWPEYTGSCESTRAYVVERQDRVSKWVAQIQDGYMRLQWPAEAPPPQMWNTSNPPDETQILAYPVDLPACRFLHAVELGSVRGLTFFFEPGGALRNIHVHRFDHPCAISTYDRLGYRTRQFLVWVYLPIPEGDELVVFGLRTFRRRPFGKLPPRFASLLPPYFNPVGDGAYHSWAPLDGVSTSVVFYGGEARYCRGVLLYYTNGGCRAIGQCRVQADPSKKVDGSLFCFRADKFRTSTQKELYRQSDSKRQKCVTWSKNRNRDRVESVVNKALLHKNPIPSLLHACPL
ncbi:hypothetical protein VTK73DRAFT_1420 [Phialemonium thermophilum]|uniref:F-box domain-containing protein n=1 Tax=Phialemonium thermophilum TaxID=223376 RepID=A0ABR3VTH3_9PEZI